MNDYYIQGSDHYLIPKDIFEELFNEMNNLKAEYSKALELLCKYNVPCEIEGFMDKNTDYCELNCGVDKEVFKECWRRYIKQELENGNNE